MKALCHFCEEQGQGCRRVHLNHFRLSSGRIRNCQHKNEVGRDSHRHDRYTYFQINELTQKSVSMCYSLPLPSQRLKRQLGYSISNYTMCSRCLTSQGSHFQCHRRIFLCQILEMDSLRTSDRHRLSFRNQLDHLTVQVNPSNARVFHRWHEAFSCVQYEVVNVIE